MSDFDDLVASLGTDTDRLPLPPPADLRAAGDARTRRNVVAMAGLVVIVVAMLAGAGLALANPRAMPQQPASVGPSNLPPGPVVTPTGPAVTPSPPAPTSTSPSPVPGAPCHAGDIVYVTSLVQGAMGSSITTYTVRNRGPVSCTLTGEPRLRYANGGGAAVDVPASYTQGGPVLVPPGGQASFDVEVPNGYSGYQPGSSACAHPATYTHLALMLADESGLPLGPNAQISLLCGSVRVGAWRSGT
jgi:uncharacterized protein DUF4232